MELQTLRVLARQLATSQSVQPGEVTREHLEGLIVEMYERRLTPATVNRRLGTWKRFFGLLARRGMIASDPSCAIRYLREEPRRLPPPLSPEELKALVSQTATAKSPAEVRTAAMVALAATNGLSIGEMLRLRVDEVDLERASARVSGHRARLVSLGAVSAECLRRWLPLRERYARSSEHLFVSTTRGGPVGLGACRAILARWSRAAGLPYAGWTALRRAYVAAIVAVLASSAIWAAAPDPAAKAEVLRHLRRALRPLPPT